MDTKAGLEATFRWTGWVPETLWEDDVVRAFLCVSMCVCVRACVCLLIRRATLVFAGRHHGGHVGSPATIVLVIAHHSRGENNSQQATTV